MRRFHILVACVVLTVSMTGCGHFQQWWSGFGAAVCPPCLGSSPCMDGNTSVYSQEFPAYSSEFSVPTIPVPAGAVIQAPSNVTEGPLTPVQ